MLTVKVVTKTKEYTFSALSVIQEYDDGDTIRCILPHSALNEEERIHPTPGYSKVANTTVTPTRVYVMNEHGKTVVNYTL